jgi:phosphoribosylamine--glycine ligase
VIKADGLALGKGVVIALNEAEAETALTSMLEDGQFGEAGAIVVIEEFLDGPECSIHALVGGEGWQLLEPAMDHKKAFDHDQGPNTGGMGTVSPLGFFGDELWERVKKELMDPFMRGLQKEGIAFHGLLFPGLIVTKNGFRVLEFNVRFGDPETQVLMRRLESPLLDLLEATIAGELTAITPVWDSRSSVCVVAASGGYPGSYQKGREISGLEQAAAHPDIVVFHAGTSRDPDGKITTSGGRVLGISSLGSSLSDARNKALRALGEIHFDDMQFRTDIGLKAE